MIRQTMDDKAMFAIALEEAKKGFAVGGLPVSYTPHVKSPFDSLVLWAYIISQLTSAFQIGACLGSKEGKVLGRGHNKRVQEGSVIKHVRHARNNPVAHQPKRSPTPSPFPANILPAPTPQAEMSALEHTITDPSHPPPASLYRGATMFTTLVPCIMCTGACLLYGIGRVVYGTGANQTAKPDTLALLREHGVETVGLGVKECEEMMEEWIRGNPERYRAEPWCDE